MSIYSVSTISFHTLRDRLRTWNSLDVRPDRLLHQNDPDYLVSECNVVGQVAERVI